MECYKILRKESRSDKLWSLSYFQLPEQYKVQYRVGHESFGVNDSALFTFDNVFNTYYSFREFVGGFLNRSFGIYRCEGNNIVNYKGINYFPSLHLVYFDVEKYWRLFNERKFDDINILYGRSVMPTLDICIGTLLFKSITVIRELSDTEIIESVAKEYEKK